jgi:MFS family permease
MGWLSNIITVHQIAHIVGNGFPSLFAASVIGIMSLWRAASGTIWGGLSDRCGREVIFTLGTCLCVAGSACLALLRPSASVWLLHGYALTFGLGVACMGCVYAAATADLFYGPRLGTILGVLEVGWGLGGFGGSWFGGYWYDHWGSYHGVFVWTMGVSLLGCLALWLAAPRHLRRAVHHPLSVA